MEISLEAILKEVSSVNKTRKKVNKDGKIEGSVQKIAMEVDLLRNLKLPQEIRLDLDQWVKEYSLSGTASEELFKPLFPDAENLFMESTPR